MTGSSGARSRPLPPARSAAAAAHVRSARLAAAERRLTFVARVLDDLVTIPGTGHRVGVEPIVGLIPGVGDLLSAGVGIWLIVEATRFRLPVSVVGRMVLNTLVDLVVGIVPFFGDLFDFAWKANIKNMVLLERHVAEEHRASPGDWAFVIVSIVLVLVVAAVPFLLAGWLFRLIAQWV
jgi:hypothetical protein